MEVGESQLKLVGGMPYKGWMKRVLLTLGLILSLGLAGWAAPETGGLLGRLLAIADPDQVVAFQQLKLSPDQVSQLRQAAFEFAPRIEQMKSVPGGQVLLVPEALARVDGILTPEQRPLARKLVPRSHQWPKLKALYHDYSGSR